MTKEKWAVATTTKAQAQREARGPLGGFGLGEIGARRGPGLMRYRVEEKGGAQVRANLLQSERQNQGQGGEKRFCDYQRCAARENKGRKGGGTAVGEEGGSEGERGEESEEEPGERRTGGRK